ncbi:YbaY family lipoprotein [Leptolyngbya ohadii]|uniref:YbaY family lipoprotein n=1 Tax=Leptolyngbya ohadii TaxID=1962290 RepID=UPI0019D43173|nr:YbaY family lipoprotein [Leptolyngbya ohadii]
MLLKLLSFLANGTIALTLTVAALARDTPLAFAMPCETQQTNGSPHNRSTNMVSGTVTYRQRIALPPDARLVVRLEDVSRADAAAIVIAEETIETAGQQVPISFRLTYDPSRIEERNRYHVRAQIFYGDALRWTSTVMYPVITQGNATEVAILLQPVGQ